MESFNLNLNVTFELRDENQAGLPAMRFRRDAKGKRITSKSHHLDPCSDQIFSPQSEEEEEELGVTHLQGTNFRAFLAPSSFECEDESEIDPAYVYCKNIHNQTGKRSTGIIEFSADKAGQDVTPADYDFSNRKTAKNKRSATMHSLASALSSVTNLALGTARHHHSSPLRTRASTESDHLQQINRPINRVMASVDEETAGTNATRVTHQQSLDNTNISRTSRAGSSGSMLGAQIPFCTTAIGNSTIGIPTTRAERSSAALYTAILNRVDLIQNQMNDYENILLQKLDTITRLLQLILPDSVNINGNQTKIEDLLLEPLTIANNNNLKSLQMPIINSALMQQQQSPSSRMCKSYTDLVKRGSTITLEEHPKSEHCDFIPTKNNYQFSSSALTHSPNLTSKQQPSVTASTSSRPVLQQQQRIYGNSKYPFRNAQSMFESYDHNNNSAACQSNLQTQLSITQISTTTISTNLTTTSIQQQSSNNNNNYLTTSTNYNLGLGHSLASLELSDLDLDEVNAQTNELQLLINQPLTPLTQPEDRSSQATSLRPRSPFDQVSSLSSYSSNRLFQRAASSTNNSSTNEPHQDSRLSTSRSTNSNLVAHETAINQLGNTTLLTSVTNSPLTSTITITQSPIQSNNQTQRQDNKQNKNLDNV